MRSAVVSRRLAGFRIPVVVTIARSWDQCSKSVQIRREQDANKARSRKRSGRFFTSEAKERGLHFLWSSFVRRRMELKFFNPFAETLVGVNRLPH